MTENAIWTDNDGNEVPEAQATNVEIQERDGKRTYALLDADEEPSPLDG